MSSSGSTDSKDTQERKQDETKESVPNPPPDAPTPAQQECFLDGYEHQYELLIGVQHSVPRPRRMWDGPLATHNICDECWRRLGHPVTEEAATTCS
ncbi:hypothetical protein F4678DRAFT_336487 [Xylaria arbuscula]|nr:hypothetical protein F4678DRAFT_336487 [Xylaria arbuscula]